eukprot:8289545-Ditylum_brightwellii.AAC.2
MSVENDSLRADSCKHLSWGMTGENVLHIIRGYKHLGVASAKPYHTVRWAIDNWFTSKPLSEKMVDMNQYLFGAMKKEEHVPHTFCMARQKSQLRMFQMAH